MLFFQDGIYRVFPGAASAVSTPPTPFADRESLEAELKALEKDLGDIQQLKMLNGWNTTTAARVPSSHISDGMYYYFAQRYGMLKKPKKVPI